MLGNTGIYAGKKRRKPVQKPKKLPGVDGVIKSNPSKRHRDRLNGELDRLTDLLPFPEDVRARLDKLSVLRLSVGYLKVKSFFKATMKKNSVTFPGSSGLNMNVMDSAGFSEGDLLLQALNGFVMVIAGEGLVFYSSSTILDYLGFHQSDVVHQSVYDLIHTDDRDLFRQQLHFALNPEKSVQEQGADVLQISNDTLKCNPEQLPPENSSFLERSFVCRFRCLLDNSSGFLALKFQGRLKFLHGQCFMNEDGTRIQPQLALFTIATPIQPPSILEIRAKTLIFQTKHKLDFTPMGIDTRGKVILGYSEIELCMRGSGYQFIHAADMMHCADKHLRMIKTGESGLTVFRLLTKAGGWVWVQSNAKLVYKGGRPDFIIARQRALVNAEGEEHLRQRTLQLPFNFTTGEAVLYESANSLDPTQYQTNSRVPKIPKDQTDVDPKSLLDCFLKQDKAVYTQTVETQLPEDHVFLDSRALVNVPSNSWQAMRSPSNADGSVLVKEENNESVMAMINVLGKMVQDGDLCAALRSLDVDAAELMEWETTLQNLSQDDIANNTKAELDSILTNDVFNYMENVLFKESGQGHLNASRTSCLGTVNNNQGESFTQVLQPSNTGMCEPQLFQGHSFDRTPVNGLCARPQGANSRPVSIAAQGMAEPSQVVLDSTPKLSHYGPLIPPTDVNIPSPQQMQLQDIYSPSIELPGLSYPVTSGHSGSVTFGSCGQAPINHMGHQGLPGPKPANQSLQQCPHNGIQALMAASGQLHSSAQQFNNVAPSVVNTSPSLIPCKCFSSPIESSTNDAPNPLPTACLQGSAPFQAHNNLQVQQWPQNQQQKLPPASIMQNGHKLMPACNSQVSESQRLPPAGLWPQNINGLNHAQQGGLANSQHAPLSSCMFERSSVPLPNSSHVDGTGLAPSVSSFQRRNDVPLDQSPPQGSCYFTWGCNEPVVGTSAIVQENASISPQSRPLLHNISSPEDILAMQLYLGCSEQKKIPTLLAENNPLFSIPPLVDSNMYLPEQTQTNCFNF